MEEHVTRLLAVALSVTMGRYGPTTGGLILPVVTVYLEFANVVEGL